MIVIDKKKFKDLSSNYNIQSKVNYFHLRLQINNRIKIVRFLLSNKRLYFMFDLSSLEFYLWIRNHLD
jgi:hypothetical protein